MDISIATEDPQYNYMSYLHDESIVMCMCTVEYPAGRKNYSGYFNFVLYISFTCLLQLMKFNMTMQS